MKKLSIFTVILFALGLFMVPATFATGDKTESKDKQHGQGAYQQDQNKQSHSQGQQAQQGQQFQQQKQNLLLVDHLIGTEIQDQQGEKIGEIEKVLVDVDKGQVGFVTVAVGGVLGVGEDKYIVPFNALQKKMPQGEEAREGERQLHKVVFTLNTQKDQLKEIPQGDIEEALTQGQSREIHEHYGVSPYWEGDQRQMMQDKDKDHMRDKKDQKDKDHMMDKKDQKNM